MNRAFRILPLVLAAVLWPISLFVSWIAATGMAFGMRWEDYGLGAQAFFLAPLLVLPVAGIACAWKRRLLQPAAIMLIAPIYQALYVSVTSLLEPR